MEQEQIISRLKTQFAISHLNKMQEVLVEKWRTTSQNLVLYSPTGSGKTIAFAMSILGFINEKICDLQAIVLEPSRELAIQTTNVLKQLAPSVKVTCCYGGHNSQDEKLSLLSSPAIVVSTPGRMLDHINRGNISPDSAHMVVLDEFDKSLELGFINEMSDIFKHINPAARLLMTSATKIKTYPSFFTTGNLETIDFLKDHELSTQSRITTWQVKCANNNRIGCLIDLLLSLPDEKTVIFSNQRDTAQFIYKQLLKNDIPSGLYIGTLQQSEREKVLSMFKTGSLMVMSTTDLGGRGIDICDIKHIIHYEQPLTNEIFTHRNGRTARIDAIGDVYVITDQDEILAPFVTIDAQYLLKPSVLNTKQPSCSTIYISAGKKEKISRGDIVGYFLHNCPMLDSSEIAGIDIFDHYTLVAVPKNKADYIIKTISPFKLKKQKVKIVVTGFRPLIKK